MTRSILFTRRQVVEIFTFVILSSTFTGIAWKIFDLFSGVVFFLFNTEAVVAGGRALTQMAVVFVGAFGLGAGLIISIFIAFFGWRRILRIWRSGKRKEATAV